MIGKRVCAGVGAFLGMLILILDGRTAIAGAQDGIGLCMKVVIPSLFPFFLLSILLTNAMTGMGLPVLRPLCRLFAIPEGTESLLIAAFLGGYPVGAQSIASACRSGQLDKQTGQRMLAFCNNAGPAFLFGMIAPAFGRPAAAWLLWMIHILGAVLAAQLIPARRVLPVRLSAMGSASLTDALTRAVKVMATVCGWVVIFRVIVGFLNRWILWIFPSEIRIGLIGLLELSNGCCALGNIESDSVRFVLCSCLLACGGLCVTMQTVSVTEGLSLRHYVRGKLLQTLFSLLLSICVCCGGKMLPAALLLTMIPFLARLQKNSSIQKPVGV